MSLTVHLDQVKISSLHESFQNNEVIPLSITISGAIPNGGKSFSATASFSRSSSITEISYIKSGGTTKRYVDQSYVLLDYAGGTDAFVIVNYNASSITITITVDNSGSSYTPSSETYNFNIFVFQAPITF